MSSTTRSIRFVIAYFRGLTSEEFDALSLYTFLILNFLGNPGIHMRNLAYRDLRGARLELSGPHTVSHCNWRKHPVPAVQPQELWESRLVKSSTSLRDSAWQSCLSLARPFWKIMRHPRIVAHSYDLVFDCPSGMSKWSSACASGAQEDFSSRLSRVKKPCKQIIINALYLHTTHINALLRTCSSPPRHPQYWLRCPEGSGRYLYALHMHIEERCTYPNK